LFFDLVLTHQLGVASASATIPRAPRPNYRHWFTSAHLEPPSLGALGEDGESTEPDESALFGNYYKPSVLSQVEKIYAFEMTSTLKFTR
jgi:hypothetical protein